MFLDNRSRAVRSSISFKCVDGSKFKLEGRIPEVKVNYILRLAAAQDTSEKADCISVSLPKGTDEYGTTGTPRDTYSPDGFVSTYSRGEYGVRDGQLVKLEKPVPSSPVPEPEPIKEVTTNPEPHTVELDKEDTKTLNKNRLKDAHKERNGHKVK